MIKRIKAGEDYNKLLIEHGNWINETYNTNTFDEETFKPEENFSIISINDSSISKELREAVFECPVGEAVLIDQSPVIYLVYRANLPTDDATFDDYEPILSRLLNQDDFNDMCIKESDKAEILLYEEAIEYYSPKHVVYNTEG